MSQIQTNSVVALSPAEASQKRAGGELVILDVRTGVEYAQVHAKDVVHVPLDSFNPAQVMQQYPGKTIACICKSGKRGGQAAQMLADAGCTCVASITGGTEAWEAAGLPVEKNSKVISLERQVRIAAGFLVFVGTLLGYFVHRGFFIIPGFVGAGLMVAGITDFCGMGLLIARMPWNKNPTNKNAGGASCAVS